MKLKISIKVFITLFLWTNLSFASKESIRLLTWWDYISPEVVQKLEKEGFKLDLSLYKSNEVAFSRLVSKKSDFDAIIISGAIIDSVKTFVPIENISKPFNRDYIDFLRRDDIGCVPYLWSATVFSVVGDEQVDSLDSLAALKGKGYHVAIIDDPFEVVARQLLDQDCSMQGKNGALDWSQSENCFAKILFPQNLRTTDFKTSTAEYLAKEKSAAYGWHGELSPVLSSKKLNLNIFLPKKDPVIGVDYVCLIKKSNQKKNILNFVKLLTDSDSTTKNVKNTGYFSPYRGQTSNLDPKFEQIYLEIMNQKNDRRPKILTSPKPEVHKKINNIWQKIRYEKK